ncbi:MAG: DUF308 domain-containing protein [Paracoccaceae bacterium]
MASKQSKSSFVWSLLLGVLCLVFGIQNLVAAKFLFGIILALAGVVNLFVAYRLWTQSRDG